MLSKIFSLEVDQLETLLMQEYQLWQVQRAGANVSSGSGPLHAHEARYLCGMLPTRPLMLSLVLNQCMACN